jgi:hypothetical protein
MARQYAQGKFVLKNPEKYMGNRTPTYRSTWEFSAMKFFDEHTAIEKWASEAVKIPYKNPFTGKYTIYVPDFLIVYTDRKGHQHVELIEVKPANQTIRERVGRSKNNQAQWSLNMVKWEAAKAYCKHRGIAFRVITEHDLYRTGPGR